MGVLLHSLSLHTALNTAALLYTRSAGKEVASGFNPHLICLDVDQNFPEAIFPCHADFER